jgi:hypothetical protein
MPGKHPEPSPASASESATTAAADGHDDPGERVGPLAVARHVKGDGRALILYSRTETGSR